MPGPRPTYPCPTHARKAYRAKSHARAHARRAWICPTGTHWAYLLCIASPTTTAPLVAARAPPCRRPPPVPPAPSEDVAIASPCRQLPGYGGAGGRRPRGSGARRPPLLALRAVASDPADATASAPHRCLRSSRRRR